MKHLAALFIVAVAFTGCGTIKNVLGVVSPGDPSINLKSAESRWLLVQNPRFGDVASEPEYIWVEEDKVPTTLKTVLRGKKAIIAPPEIVARYGPPPGGGKISPHQGIVLAPETTTAAPAARRGGSETISAVSAPPPPTAKRGFVVWVDTTRIVIDLTAQDGVRAGTTVSLRRDRIPIVHPITGEVLGELDEEVATARVTELRDKFSIAEIQTLAQGAEVRIKDRVVPK